MMLYSLPAAHEVDGDLIVASKALACLGWAAPAALTARVAIERGLLDLCQRYSCRMPDRASPGDLAKRVYRKSKRRVPHLGSCTTLYGKLSGVAHGVEVPLHDVLKLVEQAETILADWNPAVV